MVSWPNLMMLNRHYQLTVQLLLILLACTSFASGKVYFITPSLNTSCPQQPVDHCCTLSQLAHDSTRKLEDMNLTLLFLPGNHKLTGKLTLISLDSLSVSNFTGEAVTITCTSQLGKFVISETTTVSMKGLHIIGCGENIVELVSQFTLENSTFQGIGNSGTMLIISQTVEASIASCSFINGRGSLYSFLPRDTVGGAIVAFLSSISVKDTKFERNSADIGAAIYAQETIISINHCKMMYNTATDIGGALTVTNNCSISIVDSTFTGNGAGEYGGVIGMTEGSCDIADSSFTNNSAVLAGGIIFCDRGSFYIANGTFSDNAALISGVTHLTEGSFHVANCSFRGNSAVHALGGGGVINSERSSFFIADSTFSGNTAAQIGGVIHSESGSLNIVGSSFSNSCCSGVIFSERASLSVTNSSFCNNSAGDGGGVISTFLGSVRVEGSTFVSNLGNEAGVLYSIEDHSVHILNSVFSNNLARSSGAIASAGHGGSFHIANCMFTNNSAHFGGAIHSTVRDSMIFYIDSSTFMDNRAYQGGAIFSRDSVISISGNTIIANNKANHGGGVYLKLSRFEIIGMPQVSCLIDNNSASLGGGISAFGSTITLNQPSALNFTDNNAEKGGGIYIEVSTIILMKKNYAKKRDSPELMLKFEGNFAMFGGAIYIEDNNNYNGACTKTTECFIQVQGLYRSILDKVGVRNDSNVSMNVFFFDNIASTSRGDNIYGGLLNRCIFDVAYPHQKYVSGIQSLTKYISNTTLSSISSIPVELCFCNDHGHLDCTYGPPPIHVKKGEAFTISLTALDQAGHAVETHITSLLSPPEGRFSEGQQTQTVQNCTQLTFNLFSPGESESLTLLAVDSPCRNSVSFMASVQINFINCTCPIGFEPSSDNVKCECLCASALSPYITRCDSIASLLLRESTNSWITYVNGTNPHRYVIYPHCPYDYCYPADSNVSINLTLPNGADAQCAFGRAGVLCGGCENNLSLSLGSSRCFPCGRFWPAEMFGILLAAIIFGVLLVATLLVLNLTVATGVVNGFIFYANIVAASSSAFFSSSKPSYPTVFVAWLNLDIGFDVCFFDGLDAYTKTWLQLAFPAYIITLVVLVIVISEHSPRFTRLIGWRDPVATLATLILLSFAKLLSTTIGVLSFAILEYPEGSRVVWLLDGNVKYLQGRHIVLFTAAIVIVLLGVPYTVLLFFWQWCIRTPNWKIFGWIRNTRLSAFITTYHAPYSVRHRYWTGLLLLVRVVLYITAAVTASSDPEVPLSTTAILIGGLLLLKGIIGSLYKDILVDIVETIIYFNLLAFAVLSLYHFNSDVTKQTAIAYISTTTILILLVGVVLIVVKKKWCKPSAVEDNIAPVQAIGPRAEHAKVTHSYVDFRSLQSEQQLNKTDELQLKLINSE